MWHGQKVCVIDIRCSIDRNCFALNIDGCQSILLISVPILKGARQLTRISKRNTNGFSTGPNSMTV